MDSLRRKSCSAKRTRSITFWANRTRGSHRLGRCDRRVRLIGALERISHKAGRLHLLDETAKIARAGGVAPLRRAHGLTDLHEPAVDDAHIGMGLGVGHERLLDAAGGFELVL